MSGIFAAAGQYPNAICGHCEGDDKDVPAQAATKVGDGHTDDRVFDPINGKSCKSKVSLKAGGTQLSVLSGVGLLVMNRLQVWERE